MTIAIPYGLFLCFAQVAEYRNCKMRRWTWINHDKLYKANVRHNFAYPILRKLLLVQRHCIIPYQQFKGVMAHTHIPFTFNFSITFFFNLPKYKNKIKNLSLHSSNTPFHIITGIPISHSLWYFRWPLFSVSKINEN